MPTLPSFRLPVRARRACRVGLPVLLSSVLATGALVTGGSTAAFADATTGTFTIGGDPIALNQASDPEIGDLTPSADAATNGMFGTEFAFPLLPLHAGVTRQGSVVSYGTPLTDVTHAGLTYDLWDVSKGYGADTHTQSTSMGQYDGFCNALTEMPDGRFLMTGGNSNYGSMIYDPTTGAVTMGDDMAQPRWYATTIRLTDGRYLVLGGSANSDTEAWQTPDDNSSIGTVPEIGDGTGAWTELTGAASTDFFGATDSHWWYPRTFNAPDGDVVGMSGTEVWELNTAGTGSVQQIGSLPYDPRVSGSQVMFAPGRILVAGGGQHSNNTDEAATNQTAIVELSAAGGAAHTFSATPMHSARNWLNLTVLPTGLVWADGGTTVGMGYDDPAADAVKQSEMFNPATDTWTLAATAQRIRTYHSVALLMPSGAVLTGGGGSPGPEDNENGEMYYPAYLFTKSANGTVSWADRPEIDTISGSATYGGTLALGVGANEDIASASLISLPAVTHSQNTDQRRIPLTVQQNGATVTATLPDSSSTMPAGDYELTVVNSKGVPSAAQIVTIRNGQAGLVTVGSATQVKDAPAGNGAGTAQGAGATEAGGTTTGGTTTGGATTGGATTGGATTGGATTGGSTTGGATTGGTTGGTVATPAAPTGSVSLKLDESIGIEPVDQLGSRLNSIGSNAVLQPVGASSGAIRKAGSSWVVRAGLASSSGISLESVARPGYYLTTGPRTGGTLQVLKYSRSASFAARATFVAGLGAVGQDTSLRSWANRSYVLRHVGNGLIMQKLDTSAKGRYDSTFAIRAGYTAAPAVWLTKGSAVGLQSAGRTGTLIGGLGTHVSLQQVGLTASSTLKRDSTWIVHTSGKGISLESAAHRGWFLATSSYGTGAMVLARWNASTSFTARDTFLVGSGLAGHDRSLRLAAHPSQYLTQSGSGLVVRIASAATRAAATFVVHTAPAR